MVKAGLERHDPRSSVQRHVALSVAGAVSGLEAGHRAHLDSLSATSTLGEELGLEAVHEELYEAMDWRERQGRIETALEASSHHGTLVLYDVTSSYLEGRHSPLGRRLLA